LVLTCIAFIWGGGGDTYVALTNSQPTQLTCAEFFAKRPGAKWLELTECDVKYQDAVEVSYKFGVVEGYYVPLVPRGSADKASSLMVRVETAEQLPRLARQEKISGVAQFGIESDDSVREALAEAGIPITEDFIILDPADKPDLAASSIMLGIGLLIGLFLWKKATKATKEKEDIKPVHEHVDEMFPPPPTAPPVGTSASAGPSREPAETAALR